MPSLPVLFLPCVSALSPHFQLLFPHWAIPHLMLTQNVTFLITVTINADRVLLLLFWLVQIKRWLPHSPPVLPVAQLQLSATMEYRTEHKLIFALHLHYLSEWKVSDLRDSYYFVELYFLISPLVQKDFRAFGNAKTHSIFYTSFCC